MSAYPFHKDLRLNHLHKSLISLIHSPFFTFSLPPLSTLTWNTIATNPSERERLEFVGDRIIGALIAEELYRLSPNEDPHFYTRASTVLVANSTFAHIMHKLGYHNITMGVKPAGDAFETVMAAYKQEAGQEAFERYARNAFEPLVRFVCRTYDQIRSPYYGLVKTQVRVGNKHRMLSSRSWKKSKAHPTPRLMPSTKRIYKIPVIIDLTLDDDPDDSQNRIEHPPQASSSRVQWVPNVPLGSVRLPIPSWFIDRIPNRVTSGSILRQAYASLAAQAVSTRLTPALSTMLVISNTSSPATTQLGTRYNPICLD